MATLLIVMPSRKINEKEYKSTLDGEYIPLSQFPLSAF